MGDREGEADGPPQDDVVIKHPRPRSPTTNAAKKKSAGLLEEFLIKLDNCQLTEVPPELLRKQRVKELSLNCNQISRLPPGIGKLTTLRSLRLDHNYLVELPAEVCLLSNLTLLDLSFNSLRALPPQLALLVGLKTLRLAGNPLSDCVGSRDDSLADIYYGKGQAAAAGPSDSRAGYKRLMEHFKDNCLSREEQDELDVKERQLAADNASAGLLAVLKVADVGKLERAVEQAQRAEVERDLLSQGSTALRHARALRQAAEGQDLARLEAALETWSDWVAPDRRDGPDFWAARRAYQVLKAEATAAPYRSGASSRPTSARPGTAASSRNGGGGSAFASRPASARPATASTSASRPTSAAPYVSRPATATGASRSREGGYNQQRPVSASAGSLYSPGGSPRRERGQPYTYDQWVHDKAEQARRSKAEAEEMKRRWRDKVELERRRREAEQASNRMRERGWPDLQYEPVPFGAYATEPSRLESVRMTYNMLSMSQVYSRPQSAANSGGSPRRRTTSERQPYDSSAAYDDNDGGGGDDVNIVRYNADGSASASRPSTAAHSRPAAAAAGERSGDAAGGGGSAGSGNMQEEASPLSMMEYRLVVTTGKQLGAGTDAEVYFVLHGEQGETQKAKLPATSAQLEGGSVDTFSLTLPYVGPLTHLTLGHDGRGFAAAWLCDKVEVTEERTGRRYNFVCGEWLKGNKLETRLPVSSVDTTSLSETSSSPRQPPPPSPPPPQQQQQSSLSPRSPPSSTSATAAGGVANDGQLLAAPSPTSPPSPAPSPGSHAAPRPTSATTTSSSRPMSGSGRPMSAVAKAASAPLSRKPPCTYKITIKTTDKTTDVPVTGTDASVFVELGGPDGSSGRMPLACNTSRAQSTALLFDTGNLAELAVVANHVGQLAWVRVGHDGVGVRPRWHVAYVDVYDPVVGVTYHCPCRDWLDAARGDGRIERMLTPVVGKITNNGGGSTWGAPGAIDEYEAEIPEDVDDD